MLLFVYHVCMLAYVRQKCDYISVYYCESMLPFLQDSTQNREEATHDGVLASGTLLKTLHDKIIRRHTTPNTAPIALIVVVVAIVLEPMVGHSS
jgi:hypothetical protein